MRGDVPTDLLSFSRPDILKNPILHNYFINKSLLLFGCFMYSKNLSPREREALFATGARRVFGALVHPDSLVLLLVLGVNTELDRVVKSFRLL